MGQLRISAFPLPAPDGSGSSGDSFWTYDGSTLEPDPATTTPLEHFVVATTDDFSLTSFDGTYTHEVFGNASEVTAQAFTAGGTVANMTVDGDGSFSLTADDGTTVHAVGASLGEVDVTATASGTSAALAIGGTGFFGLNADDGTETYVIDVEDVPTDTSGIVSMVANAGDPSLFTRVRHSESIYDVYRDNGDSQLQVRLGQADTILLQVTDIASGKVATVNLNPTGSLDVHCDNQIDIATADGDNDVTVTSTGDIILTVTGSKLIQHLGHIGTDQSASATIAVGTLANKLPIYDNSGTLLGYIPIYNSIT